jgi:ferredoxin
VSRDVVVDTGSCVGCGGCGGRCFSDGSTNVTGGKQNAPHEAKYDKQSQ